MYLFTRTFHTPGMRHSLPAGTIFRLITPPVAYVLRRPSLRLFALISLFRRLAAPGQAQTPCSDCFDSAKRKARKCLDNAISSGDKNDCLENRRVRQSLQRDSMQRRQGGTGRTTEVRPIPSRPGLAPYTPTEGEWLALVMRTGPPAKRVPTNPIHSTSC